MHQTADCLSTAFQILPWRVRSASSSPSRSSTSTEKSLNSSKLPAPANDLLDRQSRLRGFPGRFKMGAPSAKTQENIEWSRDTVALFFRRVGVWWSESRHVVPHEAGEQRMQARREELLQHRPVARQLRHTWPATKSARHYVGDPLPRSNCPGALQVSCRRQIPQLLQAQTMWESTVWAKGS